MKVRNFAFFGVMAAILSVSAANADTVKRIASTNYVDNAVAPKQNKLDTTPSTGNITFSGNGNAITGVSASGDGTVVFSKDTFLQESDVSALRTTVEGHTTDIAGHTSDITGINTTIGNTNIGENQTITGAIAALQSSAITDISGKQDKSDSNVTTAGTYIQTGTGVAANLGRLDTQVKTNADAIAENASDISGLDSSKQDKSDSNVTTAGTYIQTGTGVAANLGRLDTQVKANADDIDALETVVTGLQSDTTTYPEIDISNANALANIDGTAAANQDTHCSANEPCVLTYEGNGAYKWSSIWGLPAGN